jgi:hypothetical protein
MRTVGEVSRPKKSQNGRVSLKITEICLSIFILSISASGLALAESEINGSVDAASGDIAPSPSISNVEGIWTFSLGTSDVITAVLYQSEGLIWGAAKSEKPEPMNGVLSGSIFGDRVEIKALYADGDVLTVTGMVGTFAGETIRGSYFQINSLGSATSGSFAGMRTSTDTSERAPLLAAEPAPESAVTETSQGSEDGVGSKNETVDEEETTAGFTDVHQLSAGINPRILGYAAPVTGKSRIV